MLILPVKVKHLIVVQAAITGEAGMKRRKILTWRRQDISTVEVMTIRPKIYLALLLMLVIALNYYDIMHTIYLCSSANVTEGNPFMGILLDTNPRLTVILKMSIAVVFAITMIIYSRIQLRRAYVITSVITLIYLIIAVWHVTGLYITNWLR